MKRNRSNGMRVAADVLDLSEQGMNERLDGSLLRVRTSLRAGDGSSNGGEIIDGTGTSTGGTGTSGTTGTAGPVSVGQSRKAQ